MGAVLNKSETAKNYYVFTGSDGYLKCHDYKLKHEVHDYGKIHEKDINSIAMVPPHCYNFYTTSVDNHLKQWDVRTQTLIKDFGEIDEDQVRVMLVTPDGYFIFIASRDHSITQYSTVYGTFMKRYENIHRHAVDCMIVTPCSNYLYTSGRDFRLNKICIKRQKVIQYWDNLHPDIVMVMAPTPSGKWLFTSSHYTLKQWGLTNKADLEASTSESMPLVHDWGKVHENWITGIVFTPDTVSFFTSSWDNTIKMWHRENQM